MTLNELIYKLEKIRHRSGGKMQVFIEQNRQQKNGNHHFSIHHHYHEENIYNGILQPEINEIILMPEPDETC